MSMGFPDDGSDAYAYSAAMVTKKKVEMLEKRVAQLERAVSMLIERLSRSPPEPQP